MDCICLVRLESTMKTRELFTGSQCSGFVLFRWLFLFFADEEAVVEVNIPGSESREAILRKRTAGILDMGGVSTQIAYEVPKTVSFASSQQVIICQIFFCLLWFSFNMSPSIFVLFPESEHTLTMLAEVPPSRPRRKESGGSQANLHLCLFIEVGWFVF